MAQAIFSTPLTWSAQLHCIILGKGAVERKGNIIAFPGSHNFKMAEMRVKEKRANLAESFCKISGREEGQTTVCTTGLIGANLTRIWQYV